LAHRRPRRNCIRCCEVLGERRTPNGYSDFLTIETSVTITAIITAIFATWGWKLRLFRGWLVIVPDLGGCWKGTIKLLADQGIDHGAVANIRQTLFRISVRVWTESMKSASYAADIYTEDDSGEQRLTYSYTATPHLRGRASNPAQDGTAKLNILARAQRLSGTYWTDRCTRGEMTLRKLSGRESGDTASLLHNVERVSDLN
jgi:hypothetical protein